jgi:hypothetical protein
VGAAKAGSERSQAHRCARPDTIFDAIADKAFAPVRDHG